MKSLWQRNPKVAQMMDEAGQRVLEKCRGKKVTELQVRGMLIKELRTVEAEWKAKGLLPINSQENKEKSEQ